MSPDDALNLPISDFELMLGQAVNIGGYMASGKLETSTPKEKHNLMIAQFEELKERGIL